MKVKNKTQKTFPDLDKFGSYAVIPLSDRRKVREISVGLQDYWLDCWEAESFGTRWTLLPDDPDNTTKAKYRKQLTKLGLFLFEKRGTTGNWSIWCLNLRGSRVHLSGQLIKRHFNEFGMPQIPLDTVEWLNNLLDSSEEKLDDAEEKLDTVEEKLDGIEEKIAETHDFTRVSNSLINASRTSQEHLKDDPEMIKASMPPATLEESPAAQKEEEEEKGKFKPQYPEQHDPGYSLLDLRKMYWSNSPGSRSHALVFAPLYGYSLSDLNVPLSDEPIDSEAEQAKAHFRKTLEQIKLKNQLRESDKQLQQLEKGIEQKRYISIARETLRSWKKE